MSYDRWDIASEGKDTVKCLVVGMATPTEYNIWKKATEKMNKNLDLQRVTKNVK